MEYYEALDRRVKQHDFPVVLVLLDGQPAPGLPFLRQLHWVITTDPASEKSLVQLMDATSGGGAPLPEELWRHSAPYRGLQAMTESDADFFFGRVRETAEVIGALAEAPDKLAILGNAQFPVTPKSAARRCPDFATTVIPKGPSVWRSRLFPAAPHGFSTARPFDFAFRDSARSRCSSARWQSSSRSSREGMPPCLPVSNSKFPIKNRASPADAKTVSHDLGRDRDQITHPDCIRSCGSRKHS
jgi:hypothetical protein